MTTNTNIEDGERTNVTVTAVSGRTMEMEGETVHQLLVEDADGERFPLVVTPNSDTLVTLKAGAEYRLIDLLGAVPATGTDPDTSCPDCGGTLRPGWVGDGVDDRVNRAIERLDITAPFGIVDEEAVIVRQRAVEGRVDDWQRMRDAETPTLPDFVCEACHRGVTANRASEEGLVDRVFGSEETTVDSNVDAAADPAREHQPYGAQNIKIADSVDAAGSATETVGMATGGAKDVGNFRENVAEGFTPQPEAISDEGLFYDYYFETGAEEGPATDALFAPQYATAVSEHPLNGETEYHLSVGLDSTLSMVDFERPRLDIVAVLDVSGSMDSSFGRYYYDEHGRKREGQAGSTRKIEAATEALCALTEQLNDDDRLGVVLYNNRAHVAKPLRDVGSTNMVAIRQHIREVAAGGGTNLADGFEAAWDMLADGETTSEVERRVVFMTDMMPNTGTTDERTLTRLFADAADRGIHTTFVGMGLDANADLAETLSGIRGANHYFVNTAAEFERRLGAEFSYMVTPLVYELELELDAPGTELATVRGSPNADAATGQLMRVETLFPSAKKDGEARGGVVLVRLDGEPTGDIDLVASWTERDGTTHSQRETVTLPEEPDTYAHDGVRKAVALARYARDLRAWAREVHERASGDGIDDWLLPDQRGKHERESVPLVVSTDWATRFGELRDYLDGERAVLGDETLSQELTLLQQLQDAMEEVGPGTEVGD
ncbi:vWA domain-containing protein [Halorientalis sp.]|uniref:vWA domain-containing protein n=1 Tax=Halorientalis sp. TaxID=1931229 RepID=UPI00260674A9|nr:VWA domain-containing protein [Halorientalis sp.]